MKRKNSINLFIGLAVASFIFILASCDATIHEYPKPFHAEVIVEANFDHVGPYDYKEVIIDSSGTSHVNVLERKLSRVYKHHEDWKVCFTYEIRERGEGDRVGKIVRRRVKWVDKTKNLTKDTIHTTLGDGNYIVAVFADFFDKDSNMVYIKDTLGTVKTQFPATIPNAYVKNCGAGRVPFSIDFNLSEYGHPVIGDKVGKMIPNQSRLIPIDVNHSFARFKIITTDYDIFSKSNSGNEEKVRIQLVYKGFVAAGFNSFTDLPNYFIQGYAHKSKMMLAEPPIDPELDPYIDQPNLDNERCIFMDYLFTNPRGEDYITVDFDIIDENGKVLNAIRDLEIPLMRNHETCIRGMFLTKPYHGKNNAITIDENFSGEYVIEVG